MLNLTSRRVCTATMIWLFTLAVVSCSKHLPESQLCTCTLDEQGNVIYAKGTQTFNGLQVCGVFNLPVDSTDGRATTVEATLGWQPYGFYEVAELYGNSNQGFFTVPNLEAHTSNFKYYFSASVNDLKGNPLVVIKNNQWFVYTQNVGKYNYDSAGMEVYDKAGHISLSFTRWVGGGFNVLWVQGVIPNSDSTLVYYSRENTYVNFNYGTTAGYQFFQYVYTTTPIQPLFRYTGPGWQHARLPSQPVPPYGL